MLTLEQRNELFLKNQNLVYSSVKTYFPFIYSNFQDREDYFQIGFMGLLKAINNFKPEKGFALSTYAVPMICGEIRRSLRDCKSLIHFTRKIKDIANKILYILNCSETQEEDKEITIINELENYDIDMQDKMAIYNYLTGVVQLDDAINEEEGTTTKKDNLVSKESVEDDVEYNMYNQYLLDGEPEDRQFIFKKYINGYTQMQIAEEVGLSQAQISRIFKHFRLKTINLFIKQEDYDTGLNLIWKHFHTYCIKQGVFCLEKLKNFCFKNGIIFSKIPETTLNNFIKNKENIIIMQNDVYSKKECNKLITKALMKIILSNTNPKNIKSSIKTTFIKADLNNKSLLDYLQQLSIIQINSLTDYASKLNEKYEYKQNYQIKINTDEFPKVAKSIKQKEVFVTKQEKITTVTITKIEEPQVIQENVKEIFEEKALQELQIPEIKSFNVNVLLDGVINILETFQANNKLLVI